MLMCVSEGVRVVSVSVYGCLCMCSHVYICLCVCVCPGHSPQVNEDRLHTEANCETTEGSVLGN